MHKITYKIKLLTMNKLYKGHQMHSVSTLKLTHAACSVYDLTTFVTVTQTINLLVNWHVNWLDWFNQVTCTWLISFHVHFYNVMVYLFIYLYFYFYCTFYSRYKTLFVYCLLLQQSGGIILQCATTMYYVLMYIFIQLHTQKK